MPDTNMLFTVYSSRLGGQYECHRFREYNIDLDLDTDSDAFDIVFKNPNGVYNSLFSKFDQVEISVNNVKMMKGRIDTAAYHWDSSDSYIRVNGRDMAAALVDNDILPSTLKNVKPNSYITSICGLYGITNTDIVNMNIVKQLVLNAGEKEMSVITNMVKDENLKVWLDYDTMHVGNWATDAVPSYKFTRGVPLDKMGIPILSLDVTDDGTNMPSEYIIYGTTSSGTSSLVGKAQNDYMVNNGIKKRVTTSTSDDRTKSQFKSNAERSIREGFDNSITIELTIATKDIPVKPNTTAWVIDNMTKTNAIFFIKKVTYSKDASSGSITKISMIPSKGTSDILFGGQGTKQNGGVTGFYSMNVGDLLASKKG